MDTLRLVPADRAPAAEPCCRCGSEGCPWDRIAGHPYCPDCQEGLAQGAAEALALRVERRPCAVCSHVGVVSFLTVPLGAPAPVEMDLCAGHFRALLGRRLNERAFALLRRKLAALHVAPHGVFLLHEAFYDEYGRALQPAREVE